MMNTILLIVAKYLTIAHLCFLHREVKVRNFCSNQNKMITVVPLRHHPVKLKIIIKESRIINDSLIAIQPLN